MENGDSALIPSANIDIKGASFTVLFLEKLKLFQIFFRKNSVYNKNKEGYWKHEKAILHWAWSKEHQHLARNLTSQRLLQIYGLRKTSKKLGDGRLNENWIVQDIPNELTLKNKDQLIKEMFDDKGGKLEPIMGNLYMKGLAHIIRYGEIVDSALKVGELDLAKNLQYLSYMSHSIIINFRGLLVGEIVEEEDKGELWKYKIVILLTYHVLFISLLITAVILLNQILTNEIEFLTPSLSLGWWSTIIVLLIGWFMYVWKKI